MRYAVEQWGNGGPAVVLVHGSLGVGAAAFAEQRALDQDHRLMVMTRAGYGDTPAITGVDVLADAADVVELLGDGAHLVGTSMGGIVAMNAAGLAPDRVKSLTVIEPPAFALATDLADVRRVSDAMKRHWRDANPARLRDFVVGFVAALEMDMTIPDPMPPPLAAAATNLVTERPWRVDVPIGAIADAAFPKLVVTGGWSGAFDGIARRLADLLGTELHTLVGAGHAVQRVGAPFNTLLAQLITSTQPIFA
jgi:pimeloyl-ACP methyl ester carboxylesterase